jgi:hypothetical protein
MAVAMKPPNRVFLALLALAAPLFAAEAVYPSDIHAPWGVENESRQIETYIKPYLRRGDLAKIRAIEMWMRIEPRAAMDPCRNPVQLGFSEQGEAAPVVGICVRNLSYFANFLSQSSTAIFINDVYQKDRDVLGYARAFGVVALDTQNLKLTKGPGLPLPCTYFEFLALRQAAPDSTECTARERTLRPAFTWQDSHRDFVNIDLIDGYAAKAKITRRQVVDLLTKSMREQTETQMHSFVILHEAAHVILGHLESADQSTCTFVKQEHEADRFATDLVVRSKLATSDELRTKLALWASYQLANVDTTSRDLKGLQFGNVRMQAALITLLENLQRIQTDMSLPTSVRSSSSDTRTVTRALAKLGSLRSCGIGQARN